MELGSDVIFLFPSRPSNDHQTTLIQWWNNVVVLTVENAFEINERKHENWKIKILTSNQWCDLVHEISWLFTSIRCTRCLVTFVVLIITINTHSFTNTMFLIRVILIAWWFLVCAYNSSTPTFSWNEGRKIRLKHYYF